MSRLSSGYRDNPTYSTAREKMDNEIIWRQEQDAFLEKKRIELEGKVEKSPNLTCFITEFPLALAAIAQVHDYSRGPLLKSDYLPSMLRHLFHFGDHPDHDAAVAWNALANLEIKLRQSKA